MDQTQSAILVKQINLHHAINSTSLIDREMQLAQTKNQKLIVLIQEPYIDAHSYSVKGFNKQFCNVLYLNKGMKTRTCIIGTKNVSITLLPQFCDGDTTSILVNTGTDGLNEEFVMSSSYMPGDTNVCRPGIMVSTLVNFCSDSGRPLILGCDANSHHTLWGSTDINKYGQELAEYLATTDLEILNKGNTPTFVTSSRSEVLDVTFATRSMLERVRNWHVSNDETLSDHKEINFNILTCAQNSQLFRNPRNTDWTQFSSILNELLNDTNWTMNPSTQEDLDESVEKLTNSIHSAFVQSCPGHTNRPKGNQWWNRELNSLKRECRKLYRWYKNSSQAAKAARWTAYTIKRNLYNSLIDISKKNSWTRFCSEIEGVSAMSRVHKLLAKDPLNAPGILRHPNGEFTNSHGEAARLLLDTHFPGNREAVSTETIQRHGDQSPQEENSINEIISTEKIRWAIFSFKPYKSPGYDNLYPAVIQKAFDQIETHLTSIYKASLKLGHIPKVWQQVKVVFIPKPGKDDYTSPKSFRPISLTSFLLKGLERLLDRHVKDFLNATSPISREQHAFQEGKSTETALHSLTSDIEHAIAQKEYAVCTFLDIEGAFDNTSFTAVDRSLSARNITPPIRKWVESLLNFRVITYEANGERLSVSPTKGTPQGGVLSPTLWILVIDELIKRLRNEGFRVIGYADDVAIICRGKFLNTTCDLTQRALKIVEKWCTEVGLGVNPNKTELLVFTQRRILSDFIAPKLFGAEIQMTDKVKYLGVTFTPKLNWSAHIQHRIDKAIKVFWCCRRAIGRTWGLSPKNLLWLFTAIVRPMIAYGAFIWWEGTALVTAKKQLCHLQRIVCLAITGATRTAPQLALESMLNLPTMETFIQAEARMTAFRLQKCIKRSQTWRRDHSSIIDELYIYNPMLKAPVDRIVPTYVFERPFDVMVPDRTLTLSQLNYHPHTEHWFTDAAVNSQSSGYGFYNANSGEEFCGPLGGLTETTQAELTAILKCTLEIAANSTGNNPIRMYTVQ